MKEEPEIDGGRFDSHPPLSFSQEMTEKESFPEGYHSSDLEVKWFDQFLICPKYFVKGKTRALKNCSTRS
jgi:hypothetical protein